MTEKYKVTQKFMDELKDWQFVYGLFGEKGSSYAFVDGRKIQNIPDVVDIWWTGPDNAIERNNRLIAIIKWLNGEDVFEVDKPHKFVVRNDTPDKYGDYYYVQAYEGVTYRAFSCRYATQFDTREEAQEWANVHQVIVEIDEEGNAVEE